MKILVIGIGNSYRSDDGIGLILARKLQELHLPHVEVSEQSGEGAQLIEAWSNTEAVILFDAVYSGAKPGTIFRLNANEEKIPTSFFNYSTHAFSLAESIELTRVLGRLPRHCIIFGIEGKTFAFGETLSEEVTVVIDIVMNKIVKEIDLLRELLLKGVELEQ